MSFYVNGKQMHVSATFAAADGMLDFVIPYDEQDGTWRPEFDYADLYDSYSNGTLRTVRLYNSAEGYECIATKIEAGQGEELSWLDLHTAVGVFRFDYGNHVEKIGGGSAEGADVSYFGMRYADATKIIELSAFVKMYLFATPNGYDAVVSGTGAIPDFTEDDHPYDVRSICRLHIEGGIASIGDYFMYKAFNLQRLTFADSKAIAHLGTGAFGYTSIDGEYDFTGLTDTKLDSAFKSCPKLQGVTFGGTITEIAEKSFQMCVAMRYVKGIDSVTTIGNAAFQYCTSLESIDVNPGSSALGNWVFILTPTDVTIEGADTALSNAQWKSQGDLCFVPNEWTEAQLAAIRAVTGNSVKFPIPESDNQGTDFYRQWKIFPLAVGNKYAGIAHPASGCCGIFSLFHIYNILNPDAQYDTFYDFITRGIVPKKIEVTESLHNALASCERGQALIAGNTDVSYAVGSKITALDLMMALDENSETWGNEGTSFWGVCTALGWSATEMLFESGEQSGATVKQAILDSLADEKPVVMEIVGAADTGHGMHAVTVIGYDADTDCLLIIDSTGGFDADVLPLAYWCKFESIITPDAASAVWIFDFGEEITMTHIDDKLDTLMESVNSGFHSVSGNVSIPSDITPSSGVYMDFNIPCPSGAKMVVFEADEDTLNVIKQITTGAPITVGATATFADSVTGSERKNLTVSWAPTQNTIAYGGSAATNDNGCTMTFFRLMAGNYRWTAYYWNE